jgi:hypothetical protein
MVICIARLKVPSRILCQKALAACEPIPTVYIVKVDIKHGTIVIIAIALMDTTSVPCKLALAARKRSFIRGNACVYIKRPLTVIITATL